MDKGQTTLDFAIGVSIFIFSIVFVLAFIPGTLQPFTAGAQDETAGVDRIADLVVEDLLTEPGDPYRLDGECTVALLDDHSAPGCGFDGADLPTRLDLAALQSINVTMRGDPTGSGVERLCWDDTGKEVVGASDGACSTMLTAGESPPPTSESVVTARRFVTIDGTGAVVEVKLW